MPGKSTEPSPRTDSITKVELLDAADGDLLSGTDIYLATLPSEDTVLHELRPGGHAWLQVRRGTVDLN